MENPTISIRLTKDLKELLDEVRGDASYSLFIKELLLQQKGRIKHAYNAGYQKARRDWQIVIPCCKCGREFPISADPDEGLYDTVREMIISDGILCVVCANK